MHSHEGTEEVGIEEVAGGRSIVSAEDTEDGPAVCGEVADGWGNVIFWGGIAG